MVSETLVRAPQALVTWFLFLARECESFWLSMDNSLKGLGNLTFKISGDNLTLRCDYNGEPFTGSFYKQSNETFEEIYSVC